MALYPTVYKERLTDNHEVIAVKLHGSVLVCWGWEEGGNTMRYLKKKSLRNGNHFSNDFPEAPFFFIIFLSPQKANLKT